MAEIRITGPDGSSFSFPAGTPSETINAAMRSHYGGGQSQQTLPPIQPPPGAIVHGGDGRSFMASDSAVGVNRAASSVGTPEADRRNAVQMEALRQRGGGRDVGSLGRAVLPFAVGQGQGFGDETIAAATAFAQRLGGAGSPDNYAVNQEILQQELDRERGENPIRAAVGEIGGSLSTAIPLAMGGATAARFVPQTASGVRGLAMRGAAGAADGLALGAAYGAGSAQQGERLEGATQGGLLGAGVGALAPLVTSGIGALGRALRLTPRATRARDRMANLLQRARQTPEQIAGALDDAARDGQSVFNVADAMGRTGREELGRLSRTASDTGDDVFRALETRQLGAQRRLGGNIDQAATGRQGYTSTMAEREILSARDALANQQFSAARAEAGAVNPTAAIRVADDFLAPGQAGNIVQSPLPDDSVESIVRRFRSRMTDGRNVLTDFNAAQRLKIDLDTAIDGARGNAQRVLIQMRNSLDDALAEASAPYASARDNFRRASQAADAIGTGRDIARTGRFEDNLQAFGEMSPEQQAGARIGYGSRLVEDVRAGVPTGDPTSRLRGMDAQAEIGAILGNRTNRQIGREYDMFRSWNEVAGGSATARRFAEDAGGESGFAGAVMDTAGLNLGGLLRRGLSAGASALRGESEPVRQMLARALMDTTPEELTKMMMERGASQRNADALARILLTSGVISATASSPTQ